MPRRSERDQYADAFEGNPFGDANPADAYAELHWGEPASQQWEIDGPEPALAELGRLAALQWADGGAFIWDHPNAPRLLMGLETNRLYFAPLGTDIGGTFEFVGELAGTDYTATKGGKDALWFHEHEDPLPRVFMNLETGAGFIEPADHNGAPSYAVAREGIIG